MHILCPQMASRRTKKGPGRPSTFTWRLARASAWAVANAGGPRRYDELRRALPAARQLLRWRSEEPLYNALMLFAERVALLQRKGPEIAYYAALGMLGGVLHWFDEDQLERAGELLGQANRDLDRILAREARR